MTNRKLEDFRKPGENNVSENILQTRYDFYHDKRFYKLGIIADRLQQEKELRLAQQEQLRLIKIKAMANKEDADKCDINS